MPTSREKHDSRALAQAEVLMHEIFHPFFKKILTSCATIGTEIYQPKYAFSLYVSAQYIGMHAFCFFVYAPYAHTKTMYKKY